MANSQSVVELIFRGVDQTSAATAAALANANKFTGTLQSITSPIADFTTSAIKLEAGILGAGAALTAFAIVHASKFESAALDLKKVLGEVDPPLQVFTDRARELSKEYGVAATDVLQSMANFKQAGFTAQEASQLTKNALDLVIAGGIDAAQGSDLLVASIKGFGAEAKDATQIIDLLNGVSNEYATNVEELMIGFARLSPVANAAGLSFEETAGLLTPVIEVFRSGSESANGLRTALLKMQDDSKPVQEALKTLGVSQHDANGELRAAGEIYFDVARAFQKIDGEQKTYLASQLVGLEQSAKFVAATNGLGKTLRIAGDDFNYLGSAAKEVEIRLQSAEVAVNRMVESFRDVLLSVGEPLLDEYSGLTNALTAMFNSIGANVRKGQLGDLVKYIESQMALAQKALENVARNLPKALETADLSGFKNGIDVVVESVKNLFGSIDLSTPEGLAELITTLGNAFHGLSEFVAGAIDSFKPLFDTLVEVGKGTSEVDKELFKWAGTIGGIVTQVNLLVPLLNGLLVVMLTAKGVGLIGAATSAASSLGTLATAAGWVAGPLAALAGGWTIGTALNDQINDVVDNLTGSGSLGGLIYDLTHKTEDLNQVNQSAASQFEKTKQAAKSYDDGLTGVQFSLKTFSGYVIDAKEKLLDLGVSLEEVPDELLIDAGVALQTGDLEKWYDIVDELTATPDTKNISIIMDGSQVPNDVSVLMASVPTSVDVALKTKVDTESVDQEAKQLKESFSEIQKSAEWRAKLEIAQAEAAAKKVAAIMDSIGQSVGSAGDVLTSIFGALSSGEGLPQELQHGRLSQIIDAQLDIQLRGLAVQEKLAAKEIEYMNVRIKALRSGQPLISVSADGLQPHLEAIMWEVLGALQVRVSEEGLDMLTGAL